MGKPSFVVTTLFADGESRSDRRATQAEADRAVMLLRPISFGTTKRVRVDRVVTGRTEACAVCQDLVDQTEGYVLLLLRRDCDAVAGEERTIVFSRGGPTGGHWRFTPRSTPATQESPGQSRFA